MDQKEMNKIFSHIPEISQFVIEISDAVAEYPPGIRKRIQDHIEDSIIRIKNNLDASNAEKFMKFIGSFLYVQVRSEIANKAIKIVMDRFHEVNDVADTDADALAQKFKESGYRFPSKARVIVEVAKVIKDRFEGNMDTYIRFVEKKYREDPILKIKGVGYKTRDIALSNFTDQYSLVDTHIIEVLAKTGLIINAYRYGISLTTDRSLDKNYLAITKLMTELAKEANISPFALDQYFWFLGKDFCSKRNCNLCPATSCVYRDHARERERKRIYAESVYRLSRDRREQDIR